MVALDSVALYCQPLDILHWVLVNVSRTRQVPVEEGAWAAGLALVRWLRAEALEQVA